jgi:hypothetical protein
MNENLIISKLQSLPEKLKIEALNFIEHLVNKQKGEKDNKKVPKFGSAKCKYKMSEDFDEPLNDFKEYME